MITSMRGCVAYNDLWPWHISSRTFALGLENRVRSVASTVLDGFFPYLVQTIISIKRCVACDDLWPWPISSRSFDLDFENRVHSVAFSVLDRLFPYLPQIITTIRGCVVWDDLWPWPISSRSFDLDFANRVRSVTFSVLGRLFFLLGNQYDSVVWVIMRRRGVSSERRRSSCSSWYLSYKVHSNFKLAWIFCRFWLHISLDIYEIYYAWYLKVMLYLDLCHVVVSWKFYHILGKLECLFPLSPCSLLYGQIPGYIMAWSSYSYLHISSYVHTVIMQAYLKALNIQNAFLIYVLGKVHV